jgi:acyl carrier protein
VLEDVSETLLQFVRKEFPGGKSVDLDAPLMEGVVDSLGVFTIVGFVESQFKVPLEDQELTTDNFGSVRALAKLVVSKLQTGR